MKKISIILTLILIAALSACKSDSQKDTAIQFSESHVKTDSTDVVFPVILKLSTESLQNTINSLISNKAFESKNKAELKGRGFEKMNQYVRYEITYNIFPLLSILFDESVDFFGAHPANAVRSITLDVTDGKIYRLQDLFKPDVDYKIKLNEIAAKIIEEREYILLMDYEGIEENQEFYVTENEIVIYYQEYIYTTHAEGALFISIPYSEISDIMKKLK